MFTPNCAKCEAHGVICQPKSHPVNKFLIGALRCFDGVQKDIEKNRQGEWYHPWESLDAVCQNYLEFYREFPGVW